MALGSQNVLSTGAIPGLKLLSNPDLNMSSHFGRVRGDVSLFSIPSLEFKSLWLDSRMCPAYVSISSLFILIIRGILSSRLFKRLFACFSSYELLEREELEAAPTTLGGKLKRRIAEFGGGIIFSFKVAYACLALVLFIATIPSIYASNQPSLGRLVLLASTGYATLLSSLVLLLPIPTARAVSAHVAFVFLAVLASYGYRDIWPLATYTLQPLDRAEGWLMWSKICLATLLAFVLPIMEPYPYIPVNPKDPQLLLNPEQTASMFSFVFFNFLDPLIFEAYKLPRLPFSKLPPQCDYDYTRNLIQRSFKRLDPFSGASRGRSLFFALCRTFRGELALQTLSITFMAVAKLASPVGINQLLSYLENDGEGAFVRPWFWIMVLFLGLLVNSIGFQVYSYLSAVLLVRVEAIITSLVFDHALRIRLKAELPDAKPLLGEAIEATTAPAQAAIGEHSRSTTVVSSAPSTSAPKVVGGEQNKKGKEEKRGDKSKPKGANMVGKINNLVTSDLKSITGGRNFLFVALNAPLNVALGMWFLYYVLGWSSFVGLAVMVALVPVPTFFASLIKGVQKKKMEASDERVKTISDAMSVLRLIKLFAWEKAVACEVAEKREVELRWIWRRKMLQMLNNCLNYSIPLVHVIVTFATYTLIMRRELKASIVFSSMTGFNMLRQQLFIVFQTLPACIQANVSLNRVAEFLDHTELLDRYEQVDKEAIVDSSDRHRNDIGIGQATFAWTSKHTDGALTPSRQVFRLRIEDELVFKQGAVNLIIGPTGSGKTSLLMALLGEIHYIPHTASSWFNLPREGGVAYASQESWVLNETIRDNIVFNSVYDEERYKKVIYQCGLERDLALFAAGDVTEVGEKGLTLSGGQKARVTLARAIYSNAEILLLDDILAALDVHTSRWIIDKCFKGDLVQGRTILLVTHNIAMASPIAEFVVSIGIDGRILSQGTVNDALKKDEKLAVEFKEGEVAAMEAKDLDAYLEEDSNEGKKDKGKLIAEEDTAEGHVGLASFAMFLKTAGGSWPIIFWASYVAVNFCADSADSLEIWWLGHWAQQYLKYSPSEVHVSYYLGMYASIIGLIISLFALSNWLFVSGTIRASRKIHESLVGSLLTSTFRWLDITPNSRIITRVTQDIQSLDGEFVGSFHATATVTSTMLVRLGAILLFTPVFLLPGAVIAILGGWAGNVYIHAQLSAKREMSKAKAPVLGAFGGAINGLASIRAYSAQDAFRKETFARVDRYVSASRSFWNINRWITIRIDILSNLFTTGVAAYVVYGLKNINPSNVGFTINRAAAFSQLILFWVRYVNELEVEGNSLERIQAYLDIDHEPQSTESGTPPAHWPSSGEIRVEKLFARYSQAGPNVLENVSFYIKSGERVGVIGRTGSGKSTLALALLRCILTDGNVYFDGVLTSALNLEALRSKITVIPQVPELMSGTLRQNLDIFKEHEDAELNEALRSAGLFALQTDAQENRLTLDSLISSGGSNLSVGQRQIVALARALVRQSKLLILDEATSAIDHETDSIIQNSLRTELGKDVTLITIAHRLASVIDSDKIMVLDAGRLVEFASPTELLKDEQSFFRSLVDESADKEQLYATANAKTVGSL